MNICQTLFRYCTIGCGLLILSLCISQDAWAVIPPNIKTSPDAGNAQNLNIISATVKLAVADLSGDDAVKRTQAREQLSSEINAAGGVAYTSQFYETYSKELNTQLAPLLDNPDAKVRLNVAIVVAKVAAKVNNSYLLDLTEKLLADKSPAVAMWGLAAAQNILPSLLQAGLPVQQQKLIADIKAHANNPALLVGVYDALSLNYSSGVVKVTNLPPNWNKAVELVAPEILSLLTARKEVYRTQAVVPEPTADVGAMNCLVNSLIWDQMNPAQQFQTIQLLSDIAGLAGQRADGSTGIVRDQLVFVLNKAVSAIVAAAIHTKNETFRKNVTPILTMQASAQNIGATVSTLPVAVRQVPAWSKVTDAPTISQGSTTNPSTATAK